uniref:ADP,ATP carrier protein n=1 Tax=Alexandrium catenella TaxID=2925 RepID=A0A7S1RSC7_ALECA|mmetsp:Transcript_71073/g.188965  ORF Transcript_71073/g.188965 Transcript_71073/m.188965 type:complete len:292 (+) Transcript_71073:103-978(+)
MALCDACQGSCQSAASSAAPAWKLVNWQVDVSMLSGALGGPLVVGLLTPQRNAMTLAAKDVMSTYGGLYRQVFARGLMGGFRGMSKPMMAAVPQFTAVGPVYLAAERKLGSTSLAIFGAAVAESLCTFSAQSRNAQIQFNATRTSVAEQVAVTSMRNLMGPGFVAHVARNIVAMTGIRLFSPHSLQVVRRIPGASQLSEESQHVAADFASSCVAATLSMPFNHVFSWASCTPELKSMGYLARARASASFLVDNYRDQGIRLLGRDLAVRISYTGLLFTLYRGVERQLEGRQ